MAIARFVCKWFKLAAGISATSHIHERERVSMRREVGAAGVVRIGNVRSEREDHGRFCWRSIRNLRKIQLCVELNLVAHRDLNAPSKIVAGGRLRWRWRWNGRLRL